MNIQHIDLRSSQTILSLAATVQLTTFGPGLNIDALHSLVIQVSVVREFKHWTKSKRLSPPSPILVCHQYGLKHIGKGRLCRY